MRINKRIREEAARLCSMAASASAAFNGDTETLAFLSDAKEWSHASDDAIELAIAAMDFAAREPVGRTPWHARDAIEKAHGEALIRTGWTP